MALFRFGRFPAENLVDLQLDNRRMLARGGVLGNLRDGRHQDIAAFVNDVIGLGDMQTHPRLPLRPRGK